MSAMPSGAPASGMQFVATATGRSRAVRAKLCILVWPTVRRASLPQFRVVLHDGAGRVVHAPAGWVTRRVQRFNQLCRRPPVQGRLLLFYTAGHCGSLLRLTAVFGAPISDSAVAQG